MLRTGFVCLMLLAPATAYADLLISLDTVEVSDVATLDVVDGRLMGAFGVNIDGALYDVQFLDATCAEVFSGCDAVSDVPFQSQAEAIAASFALFQQVWYPGSGFEYYTNLINGCFTLDFCNAYIFYPNSDGTGLYLMQARDGGGDAGYNIIQIDALFFPFGSAMPTTVTQSEAVFAKFTRVPEPSSLFLLSTGVVGLVCVRWRHSATCSGHELPRS